MTPQNHAGKKLVLLLRQCWLQILGSLLIVLIVANFTSGEVSMWTIVAGLLIAALGGSVAGIVVATFLARNPIAKEAVASAAVTVVPASAREPSTDPKAALGMDDALDALPDIHKDHVKVARLYGVYTIRQLSDASPEIQDNLKRAFGKALFLRSYAIANDCKRLTESDPRAATK